MECTHYKSWGFCNCEGIIGCCNKLAYSQQVGFGKGPPSKSLWVDGVDPTMSDSQVEKHFSRYGTVVNIGFDRQRCTVVAAYNSVEIAKEAMLDLRGTIIGKTRVRVLVRMVCSDFLVLLLWVIV